MPRKLNPKNRFSLARTNCEAVRLAPGQRERTVWDTDLPGFGLRIRDSGARTWIIRRADMTGKYGLITIGPTKDLSFIQAQAIAMIHLSNMKVVRTLGYKTKLEATIGTSVFEQYSKISNPAVRAVFPKKLLSKTALLPKSKAQPKFEEVCHDYIRKKEKTLKRNTCSDLRRHLYKHFKKLGDTPIDKIKRADIATCLDKIAETTPSTANRARSVVTTFFKYAIGQGLMDHNPALATNKPTPDRHRERVLSDVELTSVWHSCLDDSYGRIVRLLILTGQRRDEVAGITWTELNLSTSLWLLPSHRSKNARSHEVPISQQALDIIKSVQRQEERDYLFGSGAGPFSGFSKSKERLDTRTGIAEPWRIHDLRRTAATGMANLGVLPHVVEAVLNHVSGSRAGVAGIYNRASYATEKRAALDLWAEHIHELVKPKE